MPEIKTYIHRYLLVTIAGQLGWLKLFWHPSTLYLSHTCTYICLYMYHIVENKIFFFFVGDKVSTRAKVHMDPMEYNCHYSLWGTVAPLHQSAPGQITWLKIHRPGSALPIALVIVWKKLSTFLRKKCIRVTWLEDFLTSKWPGAFTALAPRHRWGIPFNQSSLLVSGFTESRNTSHSVVTLHFLENTVINFYSESTSDEHYEQKTTRTTTTQSESNNTRH